MIQTTQDSTGLVVGTRGRTGCCIILAGESFLHEYFLYKTNAKEMDLASPNGRTRNEIDFILSSDRRICTDVSVLNSFFTKSDHRIVRAKIVINTRQTRCKLITPRKLPFKKMIAERAHRYKELLKKLVLNTLRSLTVDKIAQKITADIRVTMKKKLCSGMKQNRADGRITMATRKLMNERRKADKTTREYRDLNRRAKKEIRQNIRNYHTRLIEDTINKCSNIKIIRSETEGGFRKIDDSKN